MLQFDIQTHTYTWKGYAVPSVTQILKGAGLIDDQFYNNDAAERGTYVHKVLEMMDKNPGKKIAYDDSVRGYVDAWKKFKSDFCVEIKEVEVVGYHEYHGFAGTIDRVAVLKDSGIFVIDIKTGLPAPWHSLQTAGYVIVCKQAAIGPVYRACVYLNNSGQYKIEQHHSLSDRDTFIAALNIYNWKLKEKII